MLSWKLQMKSKMNRYLENKQASDCCGCSACAQKCPKQCLTMHPDKDGFLFPEVVNDTCIDCGLCSKVCPLENKVTSNTAPKFYGAYNVNTMDIKNSSSGAIYPALGKWIIAQGGVVFGASLDEKHNLYHIATSAEEEFVKTLGSKYFQSDIKETYKECKADLDSGKLVLFTGTPCQIHGLKCFLRKDYQNLYTADVICHGVPSSKMFNAYVAYLEKKHQAELIDINFRDKKRNGWSITLRYTMKYPNGKVKDYYLISKLSEYFMAFLSGSIARESCYSCPFSSLDRPGDITMGDFWGYQKKRPDLKHEDGLSLIISNTQKGSELIEILSKNGIAFNEVDELCVKASENKNLYFPTKRPEIRDKVYNELEHEGFEFIAAKYFRRSQTFKNKMKNYLPRFVVKLLKK